MPATCEQLITAAYSRSSWNDPDKLATNSELIGVIDRRMKQIYSMAARANPLYFGTISSSVAPTTDSASVYSWARPSDAELIFRVEAGTAIGTPGTTITTGTEISVVPFEDKQAELAPRIYEFGQRYYTAGLTGDPVAAATNAHSLTFYYSKRHRDLTTLNNSTTGTLESQWPSQFDDLIVLHIAKYLATKDNRDGEVQLLATEEAALLDGFFKHLQHENYAMKSRWGQRARLVAPTPRDFDERS